MSRKKIVEVKIDHDLARAVLYVGDGNTSKMVTCCFCGTEIERVMSCNPKPVSDTPGDRCCNACDNKFVTPARMGLLAEFRQRRN